jgi:hypothetical protein
MEKTPEMTEQEKDAAEEANSRFQLICACIMAILAAIGVLASTYNGITGAGWLNSSQVASKAYSWYQAKSIKETIIKGQRDFALSLKEYLSTNPAQNKSIDSFAAQINKEMNRLHNEKEEILNGSKNIDKSQWSQDIDGKMGQIIGAKEYDGMADSYGVSSDFFTYATVYIQLALVIGALALIVNAQTSRRIFFALMIGLGAYGTYLTLQGYLLYAALGV